DDETGDWDRSTIFSDPKPSYLENRSVRDIHVHRDKVTGIDRIFISIGVLGIFSGVYDPDAPGKIRWEAKSESGPVKTRPLAIIEANGSLLFSAGTLIYRRNDGESPTYTIVQDASEISRENVRSPVGGIRGMSAIPNPNGQGDSILFVWAAGNRSRGCIYRLDPDGNGGYTRIKEACLDSLMSEYLDGNPVYFVLAGYNDIFPVVDLSTKKTVHLIGFESWIGGHQFPTVTRKVNGGFYAGGMYAIRDRNGKYRLNEINGPSTPCKPVLIATRTFALSPFEETKNRVVYFGGNDCNWAQLSPDWAWIFSTSLENALRKDAPRPKRLDAKKVQAIIKGFREKQKPYLFNHQGKPAFSVLIPPEFEKQAASGNNVFNARAKGSSLSISVSKLGENPDLSQAAPGYVAALKQIGNGKAELKKEIRTKLPNGTPAAEFVIKWFTKDNVALTTQALTVYKDGYSIAMGTHTWQGNLPDKKILHTIKFK
ncbi:MAG: hypothetical protein JRI34_13190, partial [Deltaproteobacteria bacterium]|nr:hypothetical protein [Deltaproteobacteria bacterium]